eukprot:364449-Chlamydomonas_euryale.AAC.4
MTPCYGRSALAPESAADARKQPPGRVKGRREGVYLTHVGTSKAYDPAYMYLRVAARRTRG